MEAGLSLLGVKPLLNTIRKRTVRFDLPHRTKHINRPLPVHVSVPFCIDSVVTGGLGPFRIDLLATFMWLQSWLNVQVFYFDLCLLQVEVFGRVFTETLIVNHRHITISLLTLDLSFFYISHALSIRAINFLNIWSSPDNIVLVSCLNELLPVL